MVQTCCNHAQIFFEVLSTEPGLTCAFIRAMVAQTANEVSVMVEGPLILTDERIERIFSAMTEYSNKSKRRMLSMRLQAALLVVWDVEARDARSHT